MKNKKVMAAEYFTDFEPKWVVLDLGIGKLFQWNPAITKCQGPKKMFVFVPVITNYLVNS